MRKISKKEKEKRKLIAFRVMIALLCIAVALVFIRSYYIKNKQNDLDIKSRYTFSVDIDAYGDEITEQYQTTTQSYDDSNVLSAVPDVYLVKTEKIARTWINAYVEQYMSEYLPYSKAVRKMNIDNIEVLNEDEHIALISFSLILKNASSDYFLSWDGVTDDGRLKCEWVMEYYIDAHADNTATIYVSSAMSPEEYGIAKYNEKAGISAGKENTANTSTDSLSRYVIRDNILSVTYDGGEHYTTVPLDVENLMYENNSSSTLKEGSYMITTSKTAFIYGGKQGLNDKMPVTICYSSDKGANWTTSELDNIYNAEDYYVDFFDESKGGNSTLYNFSYDVAFGYAVFAYLYQDGFMIASLSDGRHVIPELAVKGDGEERMKDGGYYTDVVCGKKCFYLLSQGDVETSGLSGTSSIEVYDYEGNPMKKINLDIIASHMVYDKINKRVIFSPSMDNDLHVLDYEFE